MTDKQFVGKPCKRGHSGLRFVINHSCVDCHRENQAKHLVRHREYLWKWRHQEHYPTRPYPENCECCGIKTDSLHLDHDHATNEFRGWLCLKCNVGIGSLQDSVEGVQKALDYLRRPRGNES